MSAHRRRLPTYHQATGVGEMEEKEAYHLANSGYRSEPDVQSRSSEEREENISPRGIRRDDKHDNEWVPWDSDHKRNAAGATGGKNAEMNEYGAYYKNIAEVLDPTFQRAPHCSGVMLTDDHNDRQTGNKSAPIVPPLKRKSPKEKGKKGHR